MKSFKKLAMFTMLAGVMAFGTACSDGESNAEATNGSNETETQLEGSVVIDGSGTVYPFMAKMAENYMGKQEDVSVEVSRSGTSAGFKKFLV